MDTQRNYQLLMQEVGILQSSSYDQLVVTAQMTQIAVASALQQGLQQYQIVAQKHVNLLQQEFGVIENWSYTTDDLVRRALEELRSELDATTHSHLRDHALLDTMSKISGHKISCCEVARIHACALRRERAALLLFQAQHDETIWKQQWHLLASRLEYSMNSRLSPTSADDTMANDHRTYAFG